tara:strand:- start:318 stop:1103 length:786 start_codon:yes stop_codon:yes gene_type:complete
MAHDYSDDLKTRGLIIEISDARGNESPITYKMFLTNFEDKYESNWNSTETFARMDPIYTFQNTKRTISVAFDIPNFGPQEANLNMQQAARFSRLMYPTYEVNADVGTLTTAPVFRVKMGNLIVDTSNNEPLYGIIMNYSFKPKMEAGFFTDTSGQGVVAGFQQAFSAIGGGSLASSNATLAPKALEMSFDFNVLHSHPLGYDASSGKFRVDSYPYGGGDVNTEAARSRLPPSSIRTNVGGPPATSGPEAVSAAKGSKVLDP